jgi:hypothetical protein
MVASEWRQSDLTGMLRSKIVNSATDRRQSPEPLTVLTGKRPRHKLVVDPTGHYNRGLDRVYEEFRASPPAARVGAGRALILKTTHRPVLVDSSRQ